jgi:hypothetical protein
MDSVGGWVDSRASLDAVAGKEIPGFPEIRTILSISYWLPFLDQTESKMNQQNDYSVVLL